MTPEPISRTIAAPASAKGFTLIEAMVVLTILGIMATIALPSFGRFIRDQRVKNATFDVYASIIMARSESIKRGADVLISPNSAGNWAQGWQVVTTGSPAETLKIQDAIPGVMASGPASLTYRRDGRLNGTTTPIFELSTPDDVNVTVRCIRVDPSGRPNIKVDTNKSVAGCQ